MIIHVKCEQLIIIILHNYYILVTNNGLYKLLPASMIT